MKVPKWLATLRQRGEIKTPVSILKTEERLANLEGQCPLKIASIKQTNANHGRMPYIRCSPILESDPVDKCQHENMGASSEGENKDGPATSGYCPPVTVLHSNTE